MTAIQRVKLDEVVTHFAELEDPRSTVNRRHPLVSVIVIAVMAVLAGANGPTAIARWAAAKRAHKPIDRLGVDDVSAGRVRQFLSDLEKERGCGIATRNQRLAAIHALARFIGLHAPEWVEWCGQVPYPPGPEPRYLYVGNTGSVVRLPYRNGQVMATGDAETIIDDIPSGREQVGGGGHWTRDLEFSADGKILFVAVGSRSNVSDDASERRRANILAFDPDGKSERVFAWGIRNPVGLAKHPETGQLWTSVNERDLLGDHLVPDYITHVEERGFYGWPWYYIGPNQDPPTQGKASGAEGQDDRARRSGPVALGLTRPNLLRRRAVPA